MEESSNNELGIHSYENTDLSVLMNINNAVERTQANMNQENELNEEALWNFIPVIPPSYRKDVRFSNMLDLENAVVNFKNQLLISSSGNTLLKQNDTIYIMATSPGEPYYIGRIVNIEIIEEYRNIVEKALTITDKLPYQYFNLRMNWYYRIRDIKGETSEFDPRRVYATQMEDIVPFTSYRGKCIVSHELELIEKIPSEVEVYFRSNIFYYNQLYDIYTESFYNVLPTDMLLHMFTNSSYLYVLNKKVRYIFTETDFPIDYVINKYITLNEIQEISRNFDWDQTCSFCHHWCSSKDVLNCDECSRSIHKSCLDPSMKIELGEDIVWLCNLCMRKEEGNQSKIDEALIIEANEEQERISLKHKLENESLKIYEQGVDYNKENYWFYYFGQYKVNHFDTLLNSKLFMPYSINSEPISEESKNIANWAVHPYTNVTLFTTKLVENSESSKIDPNIPHPEFERFCREANKLLIENNLVLTDEQGKIDTLNFFFESENYDLEAALVLFKISLKDSFFSSGLMKLQSIEKFKMGVSRFGNEIQLIKQSVSVFSLDIIEKYFNLWKQSSTGKDVLDEFSNNFNQRKGYLLNDSTSIEKSSLQEIEALSSCEELMKSSAGFLPEFESKYIDESSIDIESKSHMDVDPTCGICQNNKSYMWYKHTADSTVIKLPCPSAPNSRLYISDEVKNDLICIRCARLWRRYTVLWQEPVSVLVKLLEGTGIPFTTFLSDILEETNDNRFISSPLQAHKKLLEYELAQDAEMIFRQRDSLVHNSKLLDKYYAKIPINRKLHYKQTKREIDINLNKPERMATDIVLFLRKIENENANKKEPVTTNIED